MDLQQWIACSSLFPKLQHLVLNGCLDLEQIPLDFVLNKCINLQILLWNQLTHFGFGEGKKGCGRRNEEDGRKSFGSEDGTTIKLSWW